MTTGYCKYWQIIKGSKKVHKLFKCRLKSLLRSFFNKYILWATNSAKLIHWAERAGVWTLDSTTKKQPPLLVQDSRGQHHIKLKLAQKGLYLSVYALFYCNSGVFLCLSSSFLPTHPFFLLTTLSLDINKKKNDLSCFCCQSRFEAKSKMSTIFTNLDLGLGGCGSQEGWLSYQHLKQDHSHAPPVAQLSVTCAQDTFL